MNKHLFNIVFGLGALAVIWVGTGFAGTNALALVVTLVIAAIYTFGAVELRQFRQATQGLSAALAGATAAVTDLDSWLAQLPASLRNTVRLRIEGERVGLPGPALTPYLVGLLVMLGMLGTFLGMVVTLNGAVFALEATTDLQAIRSAFATPIKGLGLAFGTSVAGVASSAMLGLLATLCRRERQQASQVLDTKIATVLRGFSLTHQRQETFKALQQQSQAWPALVVHMEAMMAHMQQTNEAMGQRLLQQQERFHQHTQEVFNTLAQSVDHTMQTSLTQSVNMAGERIQPVVQAAMHGLAETFDKRAQGLIEAVNTTYNRLHTEHADQDRQRLHSWSASLEAMAGTLTQQWQTTAEQTLAQQHSMGETLTQTVQHITAQVRSSTSDTLADVSRLVAASEELAQSRIGAETRWTQQHNERLDQLLAVLRSELSALRNEEAQRGAAAVDRLGELQAAVAAHLTRLGTALEEPIARLVQTTAEVPQAAAAVIGQLRQEMSNSLTRDNGLLEERGRIMATLHTLLDAIQHASTEQRAVIDSLVASSAVALNQASSQFADRMEIEATKLSGMAEQLTHSSADITSSAVDVSSLSEALGVAVRSFNDANEQLVTHLQRIEGALDKSMARSDEQLAYYVAQAREIIDLSVTSQKEVVDELRQLRTA